LPTFAAKKYPLTKLATILLLFAMLTQMFSKVIILADYEANKAFITTYLCINRDKPQMQCHGKCYLSKQLKKAGQAEKDASSKGQNQKADLTLFCQALVSYTCISGQPLAVALPFDFSGHPRRLSFSIFHPPQEPV
jgi:hypothetical protein